MIKVRLRLYFDGPQTRQKLYYPVDIDNDMKASVIYTHFGHVRFTRVRLAEEVVEGSFSDAVHHLRQKYYPVNESVSCERYEQQVDVEGKGCEGAFK